MKQAIILLALLLLLLAACSVHKANQSATSKSEYGYIRLAGSMASREAYIDGNQVGTDPEDDTNSYRLKSGTHKLEIRSKNRLLLAEDILVTADQTVEIIVP